MKVIITTILIFCSLHLSYGQDSINVKLEQLKMSDETFGTSYPIPFVDDFNNFKGIEYSKDSLWIGRVVLNREQYWFDQSKLASSLNNNYLKRIDEYKIDTLKLSPEPLKTYISVLVKVNDGQKIIIIDANNNYDFSDDEVNIYNLRGNESFYDDFRNIKVSKVQYEKFIKDNVKDYYQEIKVKPFDPDYGYANKIDSVRAAYVKIFKIFKGEFNIEDNEYELTVKKDRNIEFEDKPSDYSYTIVPIGQKTRYYDKIDWNQEMKIGENMVKVTDLATDNPTVSINVRPMTDADFGWEVGDYIPENILEKYSLNADTVKYNIANFWGSWCGPCLEEIPDLIQFYEDNKSLINLVNIANESRQEGIESAKEIVLENELIWKQIYTLFKDKDTLSKILNVNVFPTLIVFDHRGMIVAREVGFGNIDIVKDKLGLN